MAGWHVIGECEIFNSFKVKVVYGRDFHLTPALRFGRKSALYVNCEALREDKITRLMSKRRASIFVLENGINKPTII